MLFSSLAFASEDCPSLLLSPDWISKTRNTLIQLRRLEVTEKANGAGFKVHPIGTIDTIRQTDHYFIPSLGFSRKQWRYQIWAYQGIRYLLADIGFRNLDRDLHQVNNAVLLHTMGSPTRDLDVTFGPERVQDLKDLYDLNQGLQEKVLKVYQDKKIYLDPTDFASLRMVNEKFIRSDTFTLSPLLTKEKITVQDLKLAQDHYLYATVQARYVGTGSVLVPTIEGLINAIHPAVQDAGRSVYLPFQHRVRGDYDRDAINRIVKAVFNPETTAEVTRYLVLKNDLPEAVKSRLVLELFDTMIQRGIKVFVANLDAETFRLFGIKYGFRKLMDLEIHSAKPEVIAYLDTGSSEFSNTYDDLLHASSEVKVEKFVGIEREENGRKKR